MSLTIKGRPIRFSLKWLKPPPVPPDGSMTLFEHLRELRYRLVVASLAIIAGMVLSAFFYSELFALLRRPYDLGIADLQANNPDAVTDLVNIGLASPFTLALKTCAVAGAVLTAPLWLYQLWAFVVPGLLAKEKKWALIFIGTATPLFVLGIATAYFVLPKAIAVLLGFTQQGVSNLQDINTFLSFMLRLMIVFGIAYLIPLLVLMLNIVGVVKARQLSEVPHTGDLRHLRVRRRRHPVHRPVLDAGARPADEPALPGRRGDRPHPGPAQEPADREGRGRTQRGGRPHPA